jgi:TonB-dependent SusC/RagA subfamily outer membrane receptor
MLRPALNAVVFAAMLLPACARSTPSGGPPAPDPDTRVPYGSQDSEDVTGAVSSVSMEDNRHFNDVIDMLRSNVPGLQVRHLPNGNISLRIRGDQQTLRTDDAVNQPLVVIDDMPILASALSGALRSLHPQDVASIDVVKDIASTAIYGTRGANGVILIHLKR